ncbi:MAG: DNA polymerase III subunit delta [Pseudopedobacter saltans]|uniref:DNA polymerase III subunit delta n=1 Tax=Pseudopedobacter saltans TaxID=151895 RepID=A0A2W5FDE5_9SPHI|nr:MAG: DNA polymerase III subunit delta [Pseudopedobacter saltans]
MSPEQIIASWKNKSFKPIYWLEGEESYFIDQVVKYAEHELLTPSEADFNQTIFYGKDTNWADVVNTCRRYPMFAERQVVVLKEAQQMKDILLLEGYMENPMPTTVLVVSYKEKKVDSRTKLAKSLKKNGEILSTKKLYENQLPDWISSLAKDKGYTITPKALRLFVDSIGNDLSRISNEMDKIAVNMKGQSQISEETVEQYIGISKDFNVFELQNAIAYRDIPKAIRIVQYFGSNPKAGPMQLVLPSLYNFFSKASLVFAAGSSDSKIVASTIGVHPFFVKDYTTAASNYKQNGIENILLQLHQYNLRSIGIHDSGTEGSELMKEMLMKMML